MSSSLRPSWYSHALSMNVMPASTASCTRRTASSLALDRAEVVAAQAEDADLDTGPAEGPAGDRLFRSHECLPS